HFHGDHLLSLLLNISAGQLNTLVNFESALLGLDGQFSVGGNTLEPKIFCCRKNEKTTMNSLERVNVCLCELSPRRLRNISPKSHSLCVSRRCCSYLNFLMT
ncbi:hypothetical protein, partial [Limnohabitans sp. Bal53]|uniref:hypothetical protein n=1 Tax=Limnohabitans sp. Bal53 TaxID=1977910 RepID=UPI001E5E18D0